MSDTTIKLKHVLTLPIAYSVIFLVLYIRMKGTSGGDIFLGMISVVFLVSSTLVIGLITFSWNFTEKLGLILGIVCSALLAMIYHMSLL